MGDAFRHEKPSYTYAIIILLISSCEYKVGPTNYIMCLSIYNDKVKCPQDNVAASSINKNLPRNLATYYNMLNHIFRNYSKGIFGPTAAFSKTSKIEPIKGYLIYSMTSQRTTVIAVGS